MFSSHLYCIALFIICSHGLLGQSDIKSTIVIADSFRVISEFDSSDVYYKKIINSTIAPNIKTYILSLIGLGIGQRYREQNRDISKSLEYFAQALILYRSSSLDDISLKREIYYHLGTTHRILGNYQIALEFGELALSNDEEKYNLKFSAKAHNAFSNILADIQRYDEAIKHIKIAIGLRELMNLEDDQELPSYYINLIAGLREAGYYKESNKYLFDLIAKYKGEGKEILATAYELLAVNYSDLHDFNGMKRALKLRNKFPKPKNSESIDGVLDYAFKLSDIHLALGNLDSALYYIENGITTNIQNLNSTVHIELDDIPLPFTNQSAARMDKLYLMLENRANILHKLFLKEADDRYLVSAITAVDLADSLLEFLKSNSDDDKTILHLAGHSHTLYDEGLNSLYELFVKTQDSTLLQSAYKFMERSKQNILLKNKIINDELIIEREYIEKMRMAQYTIDSLRNKLENVPNEVEPSQLNIIKDQVVLLHTQKLGNSELSINLDSIFNNNSVSIEELQENIASEELLISYFWGEKFVFILGVSNHAISFQRIEKEVTSTLINEYLDKFDRSIKVKQHVVFDSLVDLSMRIYNRIIDPMLKKNESDSRYTSLIFSPDGPLNLISYAALITGEKNRQLYDFSRLEYLVKNYTPSYSFSLSNWYFDLKKNKSGNRFLGMANSTLAGTEREIEKIAHRWKGKSHLLKDDMATESKLKNIIRDYDILHLSTHAVGDGENAEPFLRFDHDISENEEDGVLFNHEIYPMKLDARLVALSSCESGRGQFYKGEGVYSLARGFSYAGCPSIVMSLWKVEDFQTSYLMPSFYTNLNNSISLSNSLRNAQLEFITKRSYDDAHPYYWSGFVIIGDGNQTFEFDSYIVYFFLCLIPIFFYLFRKSNVF